MLSGSRRQGFSEGRTRRRVATTTGAGTSKSRSYPQRISMGSPALSLPWPRASCHNPRKAMTYCLGIVTHVGLVLASDSRTNAGHDQVNVCRKMHTFVQPGERAFAVLTSGSLSLTQSVITLLRSAFENGEGLAKAENLYSAARIIGDCVRRVSDMDRAAL